MSTAERVDTRTALLDTAEELFGQRGYAAVGVREIVERAGANVAAVNYHFGGKAELYLETVKRAMQRKATSDAWQLLEQPCATKQAAAAALAQFIHQFLHQLLLSERSSALCRLMMQEASDPTNAIEFVVQDFIRPHQQKLKSVIGVLLPDADAFHHALAAQSVLGQVLHYRIYQAFLERLNIGDFSETETVDSIAHHIIEFTLRGLGCSRRMIDHAMRSANKAEALDVLSRNGKQE